MKILITHAAAGYGHKKVAEVMEKAFLRRGLNPTEVSAEDALDFASDFFRWAYPTIYYYAVRHIPAVWGWFYETLDHAEVYRWARPLRSFANSREGRKLLKHVVEMSPDHILCSHFYSAELFSRAKRSKKINSLLTVVITDFFPHSFWLNEGTDYYWVMGEETKKDLIRRGVEAGKIIAGGIPVDTAFQPGGRKHEILEKAGLSREKFTLLLTSGSFGLGPQERILQALEAFEDRIQCLVVCGSNHHLQKRLEALTFKFPAKIFGFVDFMPELMEAADLLIAKPGGSTTVEALAKGIPMVILDPIPGQEMRNAHYLKEHNASFFIEQPEQIKLVLKAIFDQPELMDEKKRAIHRLARPHAAEDLVSFVLKAGRESILK